jgi:hypothetical protein
VLYPAVWGKPMRLFNSTIFSQAVEPVWPLFASLLFLLLCDLAFLKNTLTKTIMQFLVPFRKIIYTLLVGSFLVGVGVQRQQPWGKPSGYPGRVMVG